MLKDNPRPNQKTKLKKKSEKQFCNSLLFQNVVILRGVFDANIQIDELIQTVGFDYLSTRVQGLIAVLTGMLRHMHLI